MFCILHSLASKLPFHMHIKLMANARLERRRERETCSLSEVYKRERRMPLAIYDLITHSHLQPPVTARRHSRFLINGGWVRVAYLNWGGNLIGIFNYQRAAPPAWGTETIRNLTHLIQRWPQSARKKGEGCKSHGCVYSLKWIFLNSRYWKIFFFS